MYYIESNLVNPDTIVPENFCPDCERQLQLVREIKEAFHAHNNINESLLKATNLLF